MRKFCLSIFSVLLFLAAACEREPAPTPGPQPAPFTPLDSTHLIFVYTCGHNNGLSTNLENNFNEILKGTYIPYLADTSRIVLFHSHSNDKAPLLRRIGRDDSGNVTTVDLHWEEFDNWDDSTFCISSDTLSKMLTAANARFHAKRNYLVFSSHASGWTPAGAFLSDKYIPVASSIGQDLGKDGVHVYEMELPRFADKLPFRLNGIIFDACLMACVETAWELRGKCDIVGFSPTEIMAHGMYYETMLDNLFKDDVVQVAKDYMSFYRNRGSNPYGCYTVVDCRKMDALAEACKQIFNAHRSRIDGVNPDDVQHYFRDNHTWFYDLRDLTRALGSDPGELALMDAALAYCVLFADHTDYFLTLKIERSCGLSTYLPRTGSTDLSAYYKLLKWNEATEYVR